MELSDALKSLRLHWRMSIGIFLLSVVALGVFLYTRNTVRPPDRYQAGVDVLVPAIDGKGVRPSGVPPVLLQGQAQIALSPETERNALVRAKIPASRRSDVQFGFASNSGSSESGCTGSCSDVATLTATARNRDEAAAAALGLQRAFITARQRIVAGGAKSAQESALSALKALGTSLDKTDSSIRAADPGLFARLSSTAAADAQQAVAALPAGTPETTALLIVQRDALLGQIQQARESYSRAVINSIVPSGYAQGLQAHTPVQITPPLPSPVVPIVVFLGIGLVLALAIPILRDRLDRSIRSPSAAAAAFDATVLSVVPPLPRRQQHSLALPGTATEEAYRALAATAVATDRLPRAIVVTSPSGTLQDVVAANFAAALASLSIRVALVATNARQDWFLEGQASDAPALPELLELAHRGQLNGTLSRALVHSPVENLSILAPGSANGELGLDGLRPLLEALASSGIDVAVIAGPALLDDPNATIFAWTTRSVLWACEAGHTSETQAKDAAARLALAGASPFGVVMVNARSV